MYLSINLPIEVTCNANVFRKAELRFCFLKDLHLMRYYCYYRLRALGHAEKIELIRSLFGVRTLRAIFLCKGYT